MRNRYWAIGLAAVVGAAVVAVVNVVPASHAPDSEPDQSKSTWTAAQVEAWREPLASNMDTSPEVPIGSVSAGPGTSEGGGVHEDGGGANGSLGRPDQPAGW